MSTETIPSMELKEQRVLPDFACSSVYLPVLKQVVAERRAAQIAESLGVTIQCVHNRLTRLRKANLIYRSPRTSYRPWYAHEWVKEELKSRNGELKVNALPETDLCIHHVSVRFIFVNPTNVEIGEQLPRWRSKHRVCTITTDDGIFHVTQTNKHVFVSFPRGKAYKFRGVDDVRLLDFAHAGICQVAGTVIEKLKEKFPSLELTRSGKSCHFAFKDPLARHLTHRGVTMTVHIGKDWAGIDKSPHFSERGEFETSDEQVALNYIKMIQDLPKLHALSERLAKIDAQKLANFLDSEEKKKENKLVLLEPARD